MAHHRLFVALRPPAIIRAQLLAMMGGIAGAHWQSDEQLHCTLHFLGDCDRHVAEDVAAALGRLGHPPIAVRLDGIGCFDRNGRAESLWVGLAPRDGLKALHDKIDRLLRDAGIPPDDRAYLPHITIARFARSGAPGAAGIECLLPAPPDTRFHFAEARLYESLLGSDGAIYETVARYPLI